MKLELEINNRTVETEFSYADGAAQLTYDGQTYRAEVSQPEPGLYTVLLDNRVYRCAIVGLPGGATEIVVNNTRRIPIVVRDRKRMRGGLGSSADASGQAVLTAPMPGKIVRVMVKTGDEVTANQGVLVVEAMKMQNEVQSPKDGKVIEVKVVEGQTVNAGETMVVIE